jgi:Ricin-type beta-trefoil lectin domain-like
MNTDPSLQDQADQPGHAARQPRRQKLRRTMAGAVVLAGAGGLMLAASGTALASPVDYTASQWAELGPYGYTGQSSQVTAVYTFQNFEEQGTEMLEDNSSSMNNGGTVDVWSRWYQQSYQDSMSTGPFGPITQANYLWEFVPENPANGPSIVDGPGELINRQSGLCLDVANNNTGNDAAIDQWTCNGGTNQQWGVLPVSNGDYEIASVLDTNGKVLGIDTESTCILDGDGDSVSVYNADPYNTCEWWNIQQASYDFASHSITVTGLMGVAEVDGRGYKCVPGDKVRPNPGYATNPTSQWDYDDLSQSGASASVSNISQQVTPDVPGGSIFYQKDTDLASPTGQVMLYCDPPSTTP